MPPSGSLDIKLSSPTLPSIILDVKRYPPAMDHEASGPGNATPQERAGWRATDGVDELVAAWQAERPDLDVRPMQVLSRISRLAKHLDRERRAAFAGHGLEPWEFDVLAALRRQGSPYELSPGALLRATLVTSGTMTNRIDRLEQANLVRRRPDPDDKRGVLVTLTVAGQSRVDAALAGLLQAEQALLANLPEASRQSLANLLRTLLAPLDAD
jgi:DNA-binding MarR family transcriptional regulator